MSSAVRARGLFEQNCSEVVSEEQKKKRSANGKLEMNLDLHHNHQLLLRPRQDQRWRQQVDRCKPAAQKCLAETAINCS